MINFRGLLSYENSKYIILALVLMLTVLFLYQAAPARHKVRLIEVTHSIFYVLNMLQYMKDILRRKV